MGHVDYFTLAQRGLLTVRGAKLTDTEIKALLLNMFTAGTDTSSSTVEWAIAELLRHPRILAQVQQELDQVVGRDPACNRTGPTQLDLPPGRDQGNLPAPPIHPPLVASHGI
ncbi:hypothetical protein L3X38_029606 [Prunus dulcis]|uniref:Uncharacterized protein n=1 Tax=Prunus dulcis TaxID=3755 RepID=A0AAD4VTA3_PRUDU|nr:hypothetical protein L3X38_029606 [Prunus dulcis]